jgi:hypothetical protein
MKMMSQHILVLACGKSQSCLRLIPYLFALFELKQLLLSRL